MKPKARYENYVGVDVSKEHLDIFQSYSGHQEEIKNEPEAIKAFVNKLKASDQTTLVVMQGAGGYERLFSKTLLKFGVDCAVANSQQVHDFIHSRGRLEKNATIDAQHLAFFGETVKINLAQKQSKNEAALGSLAQRRHQVLKNIIQKKNRRQQAHEVASQEDIEAFEEAYDWISLRHAPSLKRFQQFERPPATHRIFDWVIWEPNDSKSTRIDHSSPRSILCLAHPLSIKKLLASLDNESNPTLVIGGCDLNLSDLIELLTPSLHRFKRIFYEAKDIKHDKILSFPMGFISYYLQNCGYENIKAAVELSNTTEKSQLLLAAWGKTWKFLDNTIDDRVSADLFLTHHSSFKRKMIEQHRYWEELAKHQFLLAPRGRGIQAPKLAEAWMVKTVPVVIQNPCFTDLGAMGFPFVMVDDWQEVTPELLKQWQQSNKPIDWKQVRYQLTNGYLKTLVAD